MVHSLAGWVLGRPLPASVDHGVLSPLRRPVRWALAVAAFAALAAGTGAGLRDSPTASFALGLTAGAAMAALLLRGLASGLLADLDAALGEGRALRSELAVVQKAQERLRHLAHHDTLTGLPNRGLLYDRLDVALKQAHRRASCIGVIFIDLDDFKTVNDSHGHVAGDRLLVELATRIRNGVRACDTVARLGGDEFVVLLDGVTGTEDAERVAAKVLEAVRAPYRRDGHDVLVTASAGVSVYPRDGTSAEELLRSADAAMYRDKERGRWPTERLGGGARQGRLTAPLPMVMPGD